MGIIQKQAIKGAIYSYIGVAVGFITVGILFPRFLDPKEIGLLNLLVAFSAIFAQFASLGMNSVTSRLFSYFRSSEKKHHGYLYVLLLIVSIGFITAIIGFFILKPSIIANNIEKSSLFVDYIYYLIPLIFFTLFFSIFDNYNKMLYNAVLGIFLKEFLQRILILVSILLFLFSLISFSQFVVLYVICLSIPTFILLIYLIRKKEFSLQRDRLFLTKSLKHSMAGVATFGIIGGFSTVSISYIDKIMINSMIDISSTGIYATASFFGIVILIPSRSLLKIASTVIADAWKRNDLLQIKEIYYKSCINQLIVGLLIFVGIWANIDNVFKIITDDFIAGKYVIFFICLTNLIDMGTGANGTVISLSKYYYWQSYFIIFLAGLVVLTNYIFIPHFGIVGAGIATAISGFIYNFARYIFLFRKYKLQPFNYKYIIVIGIGLLSYYSSTLIPEFKNFIFDMIVRSGFIVIVFLSLIYISKVSEDINSNIKNILLKIITK